jgi:hypothetical protein
MLSYLKCLLFAHQLNEQKKRGCRYDRGSHAIVETVGIFTYYKVYAQCDRCKRYIKVYKERIFELYSKDGMRTEREIIKNYE